MAELVAGALLTSSIQLALERLASCDILDFFRVRKIQDGFLLKRLDITLNCIDKVIEDAEERQYRDPPVKRWLDELKDAVFRAEDLMDEIATEASRQKLQLQFHPATGKLHNCFTSIVNPRGKKIELRIKELVAHLEFLANIRDRLGLREVSGVPRKYFKKLPTTFLIDEADIYGRDADKERIIEILLSPNMGGNQGPVDVIAIVGMGGVGKTTLAHLVYEDQRMKNKFQHRAWVCASEEFDVVQATKAIHQELNCSTAKSDDLTSYQCQLNEKLMEGLLHSNQTRGSIEEVGKEIFNSLKSRSFFEASKESNKYIMHDLLNDLAKSVMGKFCLRLEGDWAQEISRETRYISFPTYDINNLKDISLCHQLRCFLKFQNGYVKGPARHYKQKKDKLFSVFPHLKYMRALSLNGSCNVEGLINNINNLKHLRYLDLSESRIMKLPDSICSMINLQTLKLKNCSLLRKLPSKLYKLINLHHLDLENCVIEKTPKYMGQLKHLRTMTHFAVRKHEGYDLKELGSLNHLRGTLTILNLENASDPMNVQEANLKEKHLYKLDLKWRWIPDRKVPQEQEECILKALQPSYNLKLLFIECYGGVRFPDWLGDPHLNLVSLCLLSCTFCVNLPPLGQLPFLEKLSIGGFDRITVIGPEFYGSGSSTTPFQSLSQLSICEMKQWEEWNISYEGASFPRLQELFICDCPKLKMPLPQHLHLKRLEIHECPNLKTPFPKASTMEELCLQDCGNLSVRQTSMVLGRSASASSCSAIESLA
ncbi:putative disease resistance RPP13-like protein 1 isoform X5 [Prosopis cineraria]|uniref:putative disease resistance RPP13-like protein 1 isoform X5 n=1 Tax=Prosopis cineraria TaxID=364024 RepID=UPI00240FB275|nr:putative disease resistance RPP13-like protein 1 isoform X5 [Prosopis cineraria]